MSDDIEGGGAGAGAGAGAGEGEGGAAAAVVVPTKEAAPAKPTWKEALDKVRDAIGATKGAADPGRTDGGEGGEGAAAAEPAETADAREARLSALSPEDRAAAEAVEAEAAAGAGAADDALIIDLGPLREGEEPIRIAAEDQAMADHIRSLKNRAATYDASLRIREEGEAYRAQADEMRYEVRLDPGGFLLESLRTPQGTIRSDDAAHVARILLTQPGVFDAPIRADGTTLKEWIVALAEHPAALPQEAELAEAARLKRATERKPLVEAMKFENQNARALVRTAYKAVDDFVPEAWTQAQRDQLVADVSRDLQEAQSRERVRVTDPRRVPGFVERRLKAFGVAPRAKNGTAGVGAGRPETKSSARTGPSGQKLVATDEARRRAAGPGPGAGSPAAGIPKPPAGTKLTGKDNAFDFVRKHLGSLRRAP